MELRLLILLALAASGVVAGPGRAWAETPAEGASHWAFQPIVRPDVPPREESAPIRTPVDAFLQAELARNGLLPSPPADRRTLIRRLCLNLWGLPPTPEEVSEFVNDAAPDAYERLVEKLLASPHYGERWARYWLDVARFAESSGYVENHDWSNFWRYRDWVVQSFNLDKPYDVFLMQQLAGDELEPYADENIVATGFLAAARLATEELSCVRQENDMYVDIVNTVSSAFMGLTMGCAQCHDHMFDPLTERDYYRLQAFFLRGRPGNVVLASSAAPEEFHRLAAQSMQTSLQVRRRILHDAYDELPDDERQLMRSPCAERTPDQEGEFRVRRAELNIRVAGCNGFRIAEHERKELDRLAAELEKVKQNVQATWAFYSPVTSPHALSSLQMTGNFPLFHDRDELAARRCFLLYRGDPYQPQEDVEPGFPQVLDPRQTPVSKERPRTDLARWLVRPQHPLTARVWVNRIWSYHFGAGIVETPSNFGTRGAAPTHPALLDYLASELIESGWSTKHVQRLLVKSYAYRQSASAAADLQQKDPRNRLYGRWPTRRLEAESVRDSLLVASGQLDRTLGGPSVPVDQVSTRRSVYLMQKRDQPRDFAQLFDGPTEMSASCAARQTSTTALQPLYLLNSPEAIAFAQTLAQSLGEAAPTDTVRQIDTAFQRVLGRMPNDEERRLSVDYLQFEADVLVSPPPSETPSSISPLESFCQALLNLNEFVYVP